MSALASLRPIAEVEATGAAVLIVDDTASKRMAVQVMLAPLGYDVVEADSGRSALRAVMRQDFAVILMDVRMPTMDGYETAKLIRERMQSELTPIIFLTAFGQDETETHSAYARRSRRSSTCSRSSSSCRSRSRRSPRSTPSCVTPTRPRRRSSSTWRMRS